MRDLYLTSTFKDEWNRSFNHKIADIIESNELRGYFAHRDTNQKDTPEAIFQQDLNGINISKIVLAICKNESPNWGAEIGYAYARNKPIIALYENSHDIPLIAKGMLTKTLAVENIDYLDGYIQSLLELIKDTIR